MARAIPYCERCNWNHFSDECCFGYLDRDDMEQETDSDRKARFDSERADRARENELDRDQN